MNIRTAQLLPLLLLAALVGCDGQQGTGPAEPFGRGTGRDGAAAAVRADARGGRQGAWHVPAGGGLATEDGRAAFRQRRRMMIQYVFYAVGILCFFCGSTGWRC